MISRLPSSRGARRLALFAGLSLAMAFPPAFTIASANANANANANAGPADLPALSDLLAQVREQKDAVAPEILQRIVQHGDPASLDTLQKAIAALRRQHAVGRAYGATRGYVQNAAMRAPVIGFLAQDALHHRRRENREEAARALLGFGEHALAALGDVFQRSRSDVVKGIVAQPLLPQWGAEGTPAAAQQILDHADIEGEGRRAIARESLAKCTGDRVDDLLARTLADNRTSHAWRLLLVELVAARPGAKMRGALVSALDDPSPDVRTLALELLGASGERAFLRNVRRHLGASDEGELRQAVVAIGLLSGGDEAWQRELLELARSARVGARQGAAVALLELRTVAAIEALHALLGDTDWRVRAEALQQVGNLRDERSIPPLVARLDHERGRLRRDLATVLRLMTGEDHGESAQRWQSWWSDVGAGFALPSYQVAERAERERRARAAQNVTQSSFYGLDVVSERVCFVVDSSGSMAIPAGSTPRTSSDREATGSTRMDVARQELERALAGLADGALFNIVFFDSSVSYWLDELARKDEKTLAAAQAFARRQAPAGATNLFGGLMQAFADSRVDTIYLLSDGSPNVGEIFEPAAIREHVQRLNRHRKVQIHGISIGRSSQLLRELAADSGGAYVESR